MRVTIEITALALGLATFLSVMFLLWHQAQGFIPWQVDWWVWLARSIEYHRGMPAGMFWPGVGFCLSCCVAGLSYAIWRHQPSVVTLSGGVTSDKLHGSARWATSRDVRAAGLFSPGGATVGSLHGTPLRHDGPEHLLAFAPTRSGKGVSLVLPTLLEWQHSVVVLDIKGENHALTAGYRASLGHRVLRFEPTALEGSVSFNPLAEIRQGSDFELMDCQNIANMVIDPDGKGLKDFWMQSGFEWLTVAILHVLYRVGRRHDRIASLADVNYFLSGVEFGGDKDRLEALLESMIEFDHGRESVDAEVSRVAAKMLGRAREERSGVHSSSLTQLSLYADPIIASNLERSDFLLDDLVNGETPAALYIIIPPSDIDRLRSLIRVIFNVLLRKLTAKMDFEDGRSVISYRHRLLLMFDEFTSIGKLEILEKSLAYMAGYGIKCFIIVQDLSQLQQAYGRDESIMSNCHVRVAFAPNKIETAKTISDMLGKQTVIQGSRSRSGTRGSSSVSDSLSGTARALMTPEEVMAMPGAQKGRGGEVVKPGEMLVLVAGFPAIRCTQRLYFKDSELLGRARIRPPYPGLGEAADPRTGFRARLDLAIEDPAAVLHEPMEESDGQRA